MSDDIDEFITLSDVEKKESIQHEIKRKSGNSMSQVGTANDVIGILIVGLATIVKNLNEVKTVADVSETVSEFMPVATHVLEMLDREENPLKLTYTLKGVERVLDDLAERSGNAYDVLEASYNAS